MILTPMASIIFYYVCSQLEGNFVEFYKMIRRNGLLQTLQYIWPTPWDSWTVKTILGFMAIQLLLMKIVPGKQMNGSLTPKGHLPLYTANGFACYCITLALLFGMAYTQIWNPAMLYDKFGHVLSFLNVFAWIFCTGLWIKGHLAPSTSDSGSTGNIIQDFFWGMELYPRVFGWDVKMFTNCRFGMMFWAVAILSFGYKNVQINEGSLSNGLAVSIFLQIVYISKFFYWEMGYMKSMDIQHDRAGYYICWGCLVWVPGVYTSQAFYLTTNAPALSAAVSVVIAAIGWYCVYINYESDHQRYVFRQTDGDCLFWTFSGYRRPKMIKATYLSSGETRTSILLVDGWWSYSRHFHYVPEILASLCWSLPALNTGFVGPYFYVIYLTILLTDRAFRDDSRCLAKYDDDWEAYCAQVPYKIVPFLI